MKHFVLLPFLLFACSEEPSEKASSPSPTVPPQEAPKPQPEPPSFPWPELPGNGWPFPVPLPGGENPMPTPVPPDNGGGTGIVDKETYLRFHNLKRCWHQVGNVNWNEPLAAKAKAHADRCVFAHDATANAGENLAMGYSSDIQAMDAWYMEFTAYRGDWSPQTGHFSQMVWKGTTEIGCAATQCPSGRFLVCRYLPQGNVIGQFKENVLPLRKDLNECQ
jgi:uncharacterized protein YkwD